MVAVTVAVPAPVPVARPAGVKVATFALDDAQVTEGVTSLVVPSLKSARAVNWVKPSFSKSAVAGDTTSEVGVALVTVKDAVPNCPSNIATMVAVPGATPVARPVLRVATDGMEDVHNTKVVRS